MGVIFVIMRVKNWSWEWFRDNEDDMRVIYLPSNPVLRRLAIPPSAVNASVRQAQYQPITSCLNSELLILFVDERTCEDWCETAMDHFVWIRDNVWCKLLIGKRIWPKIPSRYEFGVRVYLPSVPSVGPPGNKHLSAQWTQLSLHWCTS